MGDAFDKVAAHFTSLEPRSLHVPEWDQEIWAHRSSVDDRRKLLRATRDQDDLDSLVTSLQFLAKDADGAQLFDVDEKAKLRRACDPNVLARVVDWLLRAFDEGDAAGN